MVVVEVDRSSRLRSSLNTMKAYCQDEILRVANSMKEQQKEITEQTRKIQADLTERETLVTAQSASIMALQEELGRTRQEVCDIQSMLDLIEDWIGR